MFRKINFFFLVTPGGVRALFAWLISQQLHEHLKDSSKRNEVKMLFNSDLVWVGTFKVNVFPKPNSTGTLRKNIIMGFTCFMIIWYIFIMFTIYSQLKSFKFYLHTLNIFIEGGCNLEPFYLPHFFYRILTHHKNSEVQNMHRKFPEWKTHLSISTT